MDKTEHGKIELASWTEGQRERAAAAFGAYEAAEASLAPNKPKNTSQAWKDFCDTVHTIRSEQRGLTSAAVASRGWFSQYLDGEIGAPLPPILPAIRLFFFHPNIGILLWGVPAAIFGGVVAFRVLHSSVGKQVVRSAFHAA